MLKLNFAHIRRNTQFISLEIGECVYDSAMLLEAKVISSQNGGKTVVFAVWKIMV